ncbi:MAG TPA: Nif3-like dinuclear metal center hexameric protein, partial [Candidatus Kapabacteria bacterium]|nr:Nif3-like dinuclear metal center hexameric protein [Candidatus Kapabacteria bacterium]
MTIKEFISAFDLIVPQGVRFSDDNVGLHVGNEKAKLTGVMIAHEMNPKIVDEAAQKKCNLIVCYHPLVFDPLKRVVAGDKTGNIILKLAEKKVALFIAHTNFDSVKNGTNFLLAGKLGLKDCEFLLPMERSLVKVAVFTPQESVEIVSRVMWDAGAGTIGEYGDCSFRIEGTGTFFGSESSHPAKGRKSKLEKVQEVRIEMVVPRWRLTDVLQAMRDAHPYEEVAYDVLPLENKGVNYGMGAVGDLPSS